MKVEMNNRWLFTLIWVIVFQKSAESISDKEYASLPTLFHQDNFDKCLLFGDQALYCSFEYNLEPVEAENPIWKLIQEISSDTGNYRHDNLRHSICVPLTCPNTTNNTQNPNELTEAINACYDKKMSSYGLKGKVNKLECETNTPKYPVDWLDILAAIFFVGYATFVVLSTILEELVRNNYPKSYKKITNKRWGKIVTSFSLANNWYRLKTLTNTEDIEYLKPIQCVRFYNTILVILSHTALAVLVTPVANTKFTETISSKVSNVFLSSGPLCVSTAFSVSAAMLTYSIFSNFQKRKLSFKTLATIFVLRYIRLTPALAVIILFNATWWRHLGNGPNWYKIVGKEYLRCRKNWWTNLLYLNTIVDAENMCTPTLWYVAVDTQCFLMLLILLWYIKRHEQYIWHILATLLSINILATYIKTYINDFEALSIPRPENVYDMQNIVGNAQWHGQFISLIGNTCGSIIGVGFGYVSYKTKNVPLFKERRTMWNIVYYLFSYLPALLIVIIPGWYILVIQQKHDPVVASSITAIGRPIFALAIAWGLFGPMHGIGGPTNHVLRWPPAYILGRIAYGAYLTHYTIIVSKAGIARWPTYNGDMLIMYYLLGDIATSYLFGLILTLFFELPASALQKCWMSISKESVAIKKED